eukprot:7534053-Pyramimonas_sp.AAC.1
MFGGLVVCGFRHSGRTTQPLCSNARSCAMLPVCRLFAAASIVSATSAARREQQQAAAVLRRPK